MNYTIDYYFDLQTIDNENVVDILKNIIDSNNISDEPLDYQFEILDNETQEIIFKGGEAMTTIPYRYFEEVADYLTHRKREVEEQRNNFLDSIFKPTKPKEEVVVENPPTDISEPTNDEIPASTDEEYVSPSMDGLFQEPSPPMDTQVQPEVPMMDAQTQPQPEPVIEDTQNQQPAPMMEAQIQQQPAPMMEAQVQPQPAPMMEAQVQQQQPAPMMEAQAQQQPAPMMEAQAQQQQQPAPMMEAQIQQQQPVPMVESQIQQPQPAPIMDTQVQQQPAPMMDTQVQQQPAPMMDTQLQQQQQQAPMMNNQMYQGGNVKSSIITVRIIIQKMKSLPFLFLKKMRYNPTNNLI